MDPYGIGRISEDDLAAGQYVCVFNLKLKPNASIPILGQAMLIKAVCLPYIVVQILTDPSEPTVTFDCRFVNLMRVTKEFVDAQREGVRPRQKAPPPMAVQPQKKRKPQEEPPT